MVFVGTIVFINRPTNRVYPRLKSWSLTGEGESTSAPSPQDDIDKANPPMKLLWSGWRDSGLARPLASRGLSAQEWKRSRLRGNMLVAAGPGTGRTELLGQGGVYLLQTGACAYSQQIPANSFKRDAARNLRKRFQRRCSREQVGRLDFLTFISSRSMRSQSSCLIDFGKRFPIVGLSASTRCRTSYRGKNSTNPHAP